MKPFTIFPEKRINKKPPSNGLVRLGAVLFWLAAWQLGSLLLHQPLLLPSPWQVVCELARMGATPAFWTVTGGSLLRIVLGFVLGLACGTVLAVLCALLPAAQPLIALPMGIVKASPVASFAILALLFIGSDWFSVFISFLMVLPVAWSNLSAGIAATDRGLLELAQLYRFPVSRVVKTIYFPPVLPYLLSAVRVGLGFAWK
ncbi:MAG: nitrate ABC transporter permease, partial [Angelakisella sp.]